MVSSAQLALQTERHSDALCPTVCESESKEFENKGDYLVFISDGYVSFPGKKELAVKILKDTGALHAFVCESIPSFFSDTNTGDFILMRGMGRTIIPVPVHRMELVCGLVTGEVSVGVHPVLLVEGVDVILGNDLTGDRVWAEALSPNVVTQVPVPLPSKSEVEKTAESEHEVELFPVCAVT